jgi:hypothetical protein
MRKAPPRRVGFASVILLFGNRSHRLFSRAVECSGEEGRDDRGALAKFDGAAQMLDGSAGVRPGKRRWSVGGKTWRNKHSLLVKKLRKKKAKKKLKNRLAKSRTK